VPEANDDQRQDDQQRQDDGGRDDDRRQDDGGELTQERYDAVRREAVENRRRLRAAEAAHDDTRKELERLRAQNESENEKALREAADEARRDEAGKWSRRLLEAQVAVAAAGRLNDPADAVRLLPVDELLGEADDDARERRISDAIDKLIEDKPYLAAQPDGERGRRDRELVTQGARSGAPGGGKSGSPDDWLRKRGRRR
jgi:hypothetical protein